MLVHNKTSSLGLIQDNIQLNFAEFIFDILGRTLMCLFVYTHGFAVTATSADVRGCVSGDSPVTYPHLVRIDWFSKRVNFPPISLICAFLDNILYIKTGGNLIVFVCRTGYDEVFAYILGRYWKVTWAVQVMRTVCCGELLCAFQDVQFSTPCFIKASSVPSVCGTQKCPHKFPICSDLFSQITIYTTFDGEA